MAGRREDSASGTQTGSTVWIEGVGLLGPGLASWDAAQAMLRGEREYAAAPTVLPPPARLPAAERRRAGAGVKLALAVADQAVAQARVDPSALATVFTSSSGDGLNCHVLCETLATDHPAVSPTRFTNSVHNAPSGCWHIAVGSRAASTSLCGRDGSLGAGLVAAATNVALIQQPVLLVASDSPYPEPLNSKRPLPDHFGLALLLSPTRTERSLAGLTIRLADGTEPDTGCADPGLEALRGAIPAAAALPLLVALAGSAKGAAVVLAWLPHLRLRVALS